MLICSHGSSRSPACCCLAQFKIMDSAGPIHGIIKAYDAIYTCKHKRMVKIFIVEHESARAARDNCFMRCHL